MGSAVLDHIDMRGDCIVHVVYSIIVEANLYMRLVQSAEYHRNGGEWSRGGEVDVTRLGNG